MQFIPDARFPPLVEAVPERHAAATQLLGEILPRDSSLEQKQNARQADTIINPGMSALGIGHMDGQQRFNNPPKGIRDQQLRHEILHEYDAMDNPKKSSITERII